VYTKFLLTYTAISRRNRKVSPLGITALQPQSHFHLGTPYTSFVTNTDFVELGFACWSDVWNKQYVEKSVTNFTHFFKGLLIAQLLQGLEYGMDDRGIVALFSVGEENYVFTKAPISSVAATRLKTQWMWSQLQGRKAAGEWSLRPPRFEIQNDWSCNSVSLKGMHRVTLLYLLVQRP
jgi:hypothetical protein